MALAEPYTHGWYNAAVSLLLAGFCGLALFLLLRSRPPRAASAKGSYAAWLQESLANMFIDLSPQWCIWLPPAAAAAGAALGLLLGRHHSTLMVLLAAILGLVGWQLPRLTVKLLWQRRVRRIDEQFVDALEMMANSLKSGLSFLQVIELAGRELPPPLGQEFRYLLSQHKLGVNLDDCLERLAKRVPSDDIIMAVNAILTLRELGAKLSETFQTIAKTIRERKKVEAKIQAVTAQGKTQSIILSIFPYALMIVFQLISPGYLTPLFNTPLGWFMLLVMVALQVAGALWMRKIINIDV